nr:hypothetical protein [uncultured Sphingomonas sp.]
MFGCWALDTSKLPMPPEARPKSVTMCFADAASGKVAMKVDIVTPDGATVHSDGVYPLDGTPTPPREGTMEADIAAVRMPAPNVIVMALGKDKHMASTRIYAALPGGQAMRETTVYYAEDGASNTRINEFRRVKGR